jgi:hypothetical protein
MVRQMFRIEVADAITKNGGMSIPITPEDPGVGPLPGDWPEVQPPSPGGSGINIDHGD